MTEPHKIKNTLNPIIRHSGQAGQSAEGKNQNAFLKVNLSSKGN